MKITSEDLKRAYKSHIRRCIPSSREACPSAESIFNVFEKSISLSEKEKVIDHITNCCYCLREFELFLDFYRQEEAAIGNVANAKLLLSPRFKTPHLWRWATASLFAVGLAVAVLWGVRSLLRAPEEERGRLPGQIQLIFPVRGQEVRAPWNFSWERIPGAEYYLLEIFDKSLLPLWKSPRIEAPNYRIPAESANIIQANDVYFWTVTACLVDGTKREAPLEEFTRRE